MSHVLKDPLQLKQVQDKPAVMPAPAGDSAQVVRLPAKAAVTPALKSPRPDYGYGCVDWWLEW